MSYLYCIYLLHIFIAYLHRISSSHIFIAYLHCISLLHIFIAYRHCISSLHIFVVWRSLAVFRGCLSFAVACGFRGCLSFAVACAFHGRLRFRMRESHQRIKSTKRTNAPNPCTQFMDDRCVPKIGFRMLFLQQKHRNEAKQYINGHPRKQKHKKEAKQYIKTPNTTNSK